MSREPARSRPAWAAVLLLAALAGLEYGWGMRTEVLEPYYAAAVRSMSGSWHDFVYGAFDPAGSITVDKLPGALWLQALSVRAFGLHVWAIVLPQVVEGVLTVVVLFSAVRRLAGTAAGLLAALVLVATPANVALDRGNISDSLLVLLGVLAADAMARAVVSGRWPWVVLAGVWVGLAFQAKMAQAWLLVIPLAVTYLWFGPGRFGRRLVQGAVSTAAMLAVSFAWMAAVSLQAQAGRPYIDGSNDDSLFQQVFRYNGLARFGGGGLLGRTGTPTSAAARLVGPSLLDFTLRAGPSWHRLLSGAGGRDIGWLVPAAAVSALAVGIGRARIRHRTTRPVLAATVLWGLWLVVHFVVFSDASSINAYYTAMLGPAVAALVGIGLSEAWRARAARPVRLVLAGSGAMTAAYAIWLLRAAHAEPALQVLIPVLTAAGVVLVVLAPSPAGPARGEDGTGGTGGRWPALTMAIAAFALLAAGGLAGPAEASAWLVGNHLGPFDTPYQPAGVSRVTQTAGLQGARILSFTVNSLARFDQGTRYVFATDSSLVAAPFIFATGKEILPVGGFTGLVPYPTLGELESDIADGSLRFVLSSPTTDPRFSWVSAHCQRLTPHVPGQSSAPLGLFLCLPASVPGAHHVTAPGAPPAPAGGP